MSDKINLVLLGHLDHGKSTLIGRLLYEMGSILPDKIREVEQTCKNLGKEMEYAFFLDAFQDEVEGGMTIDTIMAVLKGKKHDYNVIDCPGHKEFIKNMLSGASNASSAILVISAKENEGVQEQTKRHVFLARMLGIEQLFVVVNKMDMRHYSQEVFDRIKREAEIFLGKIGYRNIFFVPISAKKGDNIMQKSENMRWYKGKPIFEIIEENAKVQSIEKFNEKKQSAGAGESIGLKIHGSTEKIKRGEICSEPSSQPQIAKEFGAEIFILSEEKLKKNEPLTIKILTSEKKCRISEIKEKINSASGEQMQLNDELKPLDAAIVKISVQEPVVIEKFSRIQELGRFLLIKNNIVVAISIAI